MINILNKNKESFINIATLVLIILLTYAAVFKGVDSKSFQNQMMESPLLPVEIVEILSVIIPLGEIGIAFLLIFQTTRFWGFLFAYFLMLTFSIYLVSLLFLFGDNLPCACGGILSKMGYIPHIIFNVFFSIIALTSALITSYDHKIVLFKNSIKPSLNL